MGRSIIILLLVLTGCEEGIESDSSLYGHWVSACQVDGSNYKRDFLTFAAGNQFTWKIEFYPGLSQCTLQTPSSESTQTGTFEIVESAGNSGSVNYTVGSTTYYDIYLIQDATAYMGLTQSAVGTKTIEAYRPSSIDYSIEFSKQ